MCFIDTCNRDQMVLVVRVCCALLHNMSDQQVLKKMKYE